MGVHGLWRLIEPSGKPVPVETLENKVLAVDISIWIHQAIKGFQDSKGAPTPNAHLLGIFHRVCKLLYFRVKPVFVFDGGVPQLKKQTIAKRNQLKHRNISEADKLQKQLLDTLVKHSAVSKVLAEKAKSVLSTPSNIPKPKENDLFVLPKTESELSLSGSDEEDTKKNSPSKNWNLHNIDTKSAYFKSLPVDVRHEILTDLKETRKQSSWGNLHELPTQSDDFSGFQMKRLLKRQEVQAALEDTQKEMGGHSLSLGELEEIMKDQGIIEKNALGQRLASDENTRYLYIRDMKKAVEDAKKKELNQQLETISEECEVTETVKTASNKADQEFEDDLKFAIALSLEEQPSTSGNQPHKEIKSPPINYVFDSDSENEDHVPQTKNFTAAQNYMMEYSGLTPNEIEKIISRNQNKKKLNLDSFRNTQEILDISSKEESIPIVSSTNDLQEIKNQETSIIHLPESVTEEYQCTENSPIKSPNKNYQESQLNIQDSKVTTGDKEQDTDQNQVVELISNNESHDGLENVNTNITQNSPIKSADVNDQKPQFNIQLTTGDKEQDTDQSKDVEFMSNSESDDDFEEVNMNSADAEKNAINVADNETCIKTDLRQNHTIQTKEEELKDQKSKIEIVIDKDCKDDDLFADIFSSEEKPFIEVTEDGIKIKSQINATKENKTEIKKVSFAEPVNEEVIKVNLVSNKHNDKPISPTNELVDKKLKLTDTDLINVRDDLDKVENELRNEMGLRERLGTNITDQMYKEAQELLELFGLPYIVAPMEAEAQCAFLELVSLTDGTITDDSDIWLFGGKTVYKNFFDQNKYVLEFKAEDIKHHFKLSREQMILLALLVGSDYTTGLAGVGPVTAMEILAAFPSSNTSTFTLSHNEILVGLNEFKKWFTDGKLFSKSKNSLRNKLKNITFSENFPSSDVVTAYLHPEIDHSEEKFTWSKPDFESLEEFAQIKFGWAKLKVESILKPVMKKLKETKYQATIRNYFQIKHKLSAEEALKHMSKRVKSAVENWGKELDENCESSEQDSKKSKPKRKSKKKDDIKQIENVKNNGEELNKNDDEILEQEQKERKDKKIKKMKDKKTLNENPEVVLEKIKDDKLPKNSKKIENTSSELNPNSVAKSQCEQNKTPLIVEVKGASTSKNPLKRIKAREDLKKGSKRRKIAQKEEGTAKTRGIKDNETKTNQNPSDIADEIKFLEDIELNSQMRSEEIRKEAEDKIKQEVLKSKLISHKLHTKEVIPQKLRDKSDSLKAKMKAIEVFRKSKQGPGYVGKRKKQLNALKDDAELSESSSDSDF